MRLWPKAQQPAYYRDVFGPATYFAKTFSRPRVPIFIYHDLEPREFERHLKFLRHNGYRTATCAQLAHVTDTDRTVVLSFDDGRRSVWSIAYPLLKRYGFKGTAFISPGIVPDTGVRPTLDDVDGQELAASNYGNADLFSWEEAEAMCHSGVIDMQLHGFAHSRVFVSNHIVDFENPARTDQDENVSAWQIPRGDTDDFVHRFAPGAPIYQSGSRWGRRERYIDDRGLRRRCIDHVRNYGGDSSFFERRDWREQLTRIVDEFRSSGEDVGRFETAAERRRSLIGLLSSAKQILRDRLGVDAEHFALPWAQGDPALVGDVATEVGVKHIHWAHINRQQAASLPPPPPVHHPRIKEMFLMRLPGPGRENLLRLVGGEYLRIRRDKRAVGASRSDA